jgi:hypothetical protein
MVLNLDGGPVIQLEGYNYNLKMALYLRKGLVLQLAGYNYNLMMALNLNGGPFITTGRVKLQI